MSSVTEMNPILIPQYLRSDFKDCIDKQKAIELKNQEQNKINYQNYLKELYELDERSPYTLIWNDVEKTYSKVLWKTIWQQREEKEQQEAEERWNRTIQNMEQMLLNKLEREKPWLFDDIYSEEQKMNIVRNYFS